MAVKYVPYFKEPIELNFKLINDIKEIIET